MIAVVLVRGLVRCSCEPAIESHARLRSQSEPSDDEEAVCHLRAGTWEVWSMAGRNGGWGGESEHEALRETEGAFPKPR